MFLFEAKHPGDRLWVSLNGIVGRSILSIFQQSYKDWKGKFVQVRSNDKDTSLLDGFPLYWVNKGNRESKSCFRRPRSPDSMGALDITFLTTTLICFEFFEDQLEIRIG